MSDNKEEVAKADESHKKQDEERKKKERDAAAKKNRIYTVFFAGIALVALLTVFRDHLPDDLVYSVHMVPWTVIGLLGILALYKPARFAFGGAMLVLLILKFGTSPAAQAGIDRINHLADLQELARAPIDCQPASDLVGQDDESFGEALKDCGSKDFVRTNNRIAAVARAKGHIPLVRQAIVYASQHRWTTMSEAGEPLHVTVLPTDTTKPAVESEYVSTAEGIFPDGMPERYRYDETVLMKDAEDHNLPVTDTGHMFALVGRVGNNSYWFPAKLMGTDSVVCPVGHYFQAWLNGRVVVDAVATTIRFSNAVGIYRLNIVPDEFAKQQCKAHPGESIIKTSIGGY